MYLKNKPKKSLGQNFLVDKNIINKIIKIGNIEKEKKVIEIGSGYGNLTEAILLSEPKSILAVEKDKKLSDYLTIKFENNKNLKVLNQDILYLLKKKKFNHNFLVFGNLPYNISTQILASFITLKNWPPWYEILIFMFQKEVADRIIAKSNTKEFSRLSVLANWRLEIKKHFNVSKNSFYPKPKVDSTVLSFKPKKNNCFKLRDPKNLEKITRILFSNRRKMINKNMKNLFKEKTSMLKNLNINLDKRPGELTNENYYKIAQEYEKLFD